MMRTQVITLTMLAGCALAFLSGQANAGRKDDIMIIPKPASVKRARGEFVLSGGTRIIVTGENEELKHIARRLAFDIRQRTGYELAVTGDEGLEETGSVILLSLSGTEDGGRESYTLNVGKRSIEIIGGGPAGVFYGVQTLHQLLPPTPAGGKIAIPCLRIKDRPRFAWRGAHLDVCRHFFPVRFIKKYIDILAMYKINVFHWHLTEDQGWRIEIKKYPLLTEISSQRAETMGDGRPHKGFYRQHEIREVVRYAASHYITVVPEIEMPGHSVAVLAAYPELSCTGGPFEVNTEWGVRRDVYCAGNDSVFVFLEDVLGEVLSLFPSTFIHIGGDECPKTRWEECPKCQARIRDEGLADEHELQSWFIRRIEKYLLAKDRRLIGWDEILEGGLAPNATVMSWRGTDGGIAAAKAGHDVVMSPTSHCYLDYYQGRHDEPKAIGGFLPVEKVYSFEPVPGSLSADEAKHILGAQVNVWTEYIATTDHVEYMLLPRLCALSEVVWTQRDKRGFDDFAGRLVAQYDRLDAMGVNFRLPPPSGLGGIRDISSPVLVRLGRPFDGAIVTYTTDGTEPSTDSTPYEGPIRLTRGCILKARSFLESGRGSLTAQTVFIMR